MDYAYIYLDYIVFEIRQDKRVINNSGYIALSINMEAQKELLRILISEKGGC